MAIKVSVAEFMFITGYSEHVPVRRLFAVQEPGAGQFKCVGGPDTAHGL